LAGVLQGCFPPVYAYNWFLVEFALTKLFLLVFCIFVGKAISSRESIANIKSIETDHENKNGVETKHGFINNNRDRDPETSLFYKKLIVLELLD
jgi:hypothetical protein